MFGKSCEGMGQGRLDTAREAPAEQEEIRFWIIPLTNWAVCESCLSAKAVLVCWGGHQAQQVLKWPLLCWAPSQRVATLGLTWHHQHPLELFLWMSWGPREPRNHQWPEQLQHTQVWNSRFSGESQLPSTETTTHSLPVVRKQPERSKQKAVLPSDRRQFCKLVHES